jgi:hypothetical protein
MQSIGNAELVGWLNIIGYWIRHSGKAMRFVPRYSLRSLFIFMAVIGAIAYWVSLQLHWIHERHQFTMVGKGILVTRSSLMVPRSMHSESGEISSVPWSLWLFGEPAYEEVRIRVEDDEGYQLSCEFWQNDLDEHTESEHLSSADRKRLARAKELFPEAVVVKAAFFPTKQAEN